jgi:site-specific DNA recombinase
MSPSHANKKGVRYRYYVSQALLQKRQSEASAICRIAAPEIEGLVVAAVRYESSQINRTDSINSLPSLELSDCELVALHVERIVLRAKQIDITLRAPASDAQPGSAVALDVEDEVDRDRTASPTTLLQLPWTPTSASARKGIAWKPSAKANLDPETIETLLTAIAKARSWMDDLADGRVGSFDDIALREGKVERHVRFLAPLAFVSPRIIEAIANGSAPADLTVSALARTLPNSWAAQERMLGVV